MRVLMINYEYPPLGGGTGIANKYLLEKFKKKKNLSLDVLTSSAGKHEEERFSKSIKVVKLNIDKKNQNIHHQTGCNLISFFIKSTVFALINRRKYDLVHAFSGLPGGATALLTGKPYIISLRGTDVAGYEERFSGLVRLIKPLIKLTWKKASMVDTNSQFLKNLVLKILPDLKIEVIPNGVDLKKFYPTKKLAKQSIILCNARFGKRKGIEYLIKAMPAVLKAEPEAKLWLVGDGIEKEKLEELSARLDLAEKIQFLGRVEHNKLPKIYRQANLFVLPSLSESFSNSLLEALACGLPIAATNIGGNPELVNKNGILVPPKDVNSLSKAIIKLLKNKKISQKMGKDSWLIANKYSWSKTAKMYVGLYKKTVK